MQLTRHYRSRNMLRLHNTLTRKVEDFKPIEAGKVNLFVCGPTVYDLSHLGHAKTYVQVDVLARVIRANDYELFYLQNITDIDDKIIIRSAEKNVDWQKLRTNFQDEYIKDMTSLNNTSVTEYARATDYIDDIISQVTRLIDNGHAYVIENDGIYFEISTFPDYGKLSGRTDVKKDDAQTRIDESEDKRGWNDFCLWKFSKPNEPVWDAPFGAGRPGWHIEDTAITEHFFGPQYDVHGGAVDLIFPHHEAEITQMESISGKVPMVGYWVHTGFLTIDSEKMAKSAGNFYTIREVIEKGYDPLAIRLFMLQSHYRSPINFTFENLDAAKNRLDNWRNSAALRHQTHDTLQDDDKKSSDDRSVSLYATSQALLEALNDDLNTPAALTIIDEAFSRLASSQLQDIHQHALVELLETIDATLGIDLLSSTPDITDDAKRIILARQHARNNQDFKESDKLRTDLQKLGIALRDTPHGSIWEYLV
ncbi:cysteine--tRNA ligase [Patescibacteria group bacterium]|nr:MAG: cysteine--tRNA ligase [Patescibacteria group bacterium]